MIVRTGIDLVEIGRLVDLNPNIKRRFLQRVYTPVELEQAAGSDESLAGLFAVKEAVSKALGTGIGWVRWQDIEVIHAPSGEPLLHLHGNALQAAAYRGLQEWSVSITHSRGQAAAVAVALGEETPPTALPTTETELG